MVLRILDDVVGIQHENMATEEERDDYKMIQVTHENERRHE
jgi:hypothetical protein